MSSTIDRSNGFLPLVPLRHADPTATGVWDMDRAEGVMRPLELPAGSARDQLLLVRLHRQPLAIVHLEQAPGAESRTSLMGAAWSAAGDAIIEHITACGCLPVPGGVDELSLMLAADRSSGCPAAAAQRPAGKAAVILCTVGAQQHALARSLRSLVAMDCESFEVVVVDNRPSSPATRSLVQSFGTEADVRYVAEPRPGLARARNAGVAAAEAAAFVAFTDDDVVVDREWLTWLLEPFSESRVQAATGLVMPLALTSAAQKRFEHYAGFGKGVRRAIYDLAEHAADDRFLYPYWGGMFGSGNSMAFRREALCAIGGFDPALGAGTPTAGGEDIAAFTDVILAGGQLVYQPGSLCWHEHRGDEQALGMQIHSYGIGLTAVLWRYLTGDWRFSSRIARSLPQIVRLARGRGAERRLDQMPADLSRLELRGRLLGPWRYVASSRAAAARDADAARPVPGERHQPSFEPSVTRRPSGGRRSEMDQAGAQTRT